MEQKNLPIRLLKCFMAGTMLVKTSLFAAMTSKQATSNCTDLARSADILYHLSMTAGMTVLLLRIRAVLPFGWNAYIKSMHVVLVGMRIIIGAVDVVLLQRAVLPDGSCQFQESKAWGPVYTVYDTLVDLYVTIAIGITLYRHVKRVRNSIDDEQTSLPYHAIIMQNVIRTTVLFLSNLATVILMLKSANQAVLIIYWPVTNILFILLIGYDSDLVQVVRSMRKRLLFDRSRQQRPSFSTQSHEIQLDSFHRCQSCGAITHSTDEHRHDSPFIHENASCAPMPTILTTTVTTDSQGSESKKSDFPNST
ncbi:hypothetical protein LRAMOSA00244 [Lichtheimia ramosa]|uniref:G-protein coupled receptors family 1 profile domain-containing protein n=1 Tax=Lichtheimia ramosa TaxID=688394 RepID=A0A077W6U9_9FUNG|nr:hypothetical protein LRAMOSA00244 [Lichtheimia ramosa]